MSLGQSHIEYGLPIWINKHATVIEQIQKKAIRNICNAKYNAHTLELFGKNNILKIKDLYKITSIRTIKKAHLLKAPSNIITLFEKKQ